MRLEQKKKTRKEDGFSLLEIMIASGMMGALALGTANIFRQQTISQKRAESSSEVSATVRLMTQTLLNKEACTETLGVGTSIVNGERINEIKNRSGEVLFNTSDKYGNNLLRINSFELQNVNLVGTPGSNRYGEVQLEVVFQKINKLVTGNKSIRKKFPLRVEVDASNRLVKCYSAAENAVQTASELACQSLGGIFDGTSQKCNLSPFNSAGPLSTSKGVSTHSQRDFVNHVITSELNPKYVDIAGDTMTGRLQVNADIETNSRVCVSGRCRTFQESACPSGQVAKKIKADGTVECVALLNRNCSAGSYLKGFDQNGTPLCEALPTANTYHLEVRNCQWTDYVNNFDYAFTFSCSGANHFIKGIDSVHNNWHDDRRFKFECCEVTMREVTP